MTDIDTRVGQAVFKGVLEENQITRLQVVPPDLGPHFVLDRHVMRNIDAQRLLDHEHRKSRAVEGPRTFAGVNVGMAFILQSKVDDFIAARSATAITRIAFPSFAITTR